ncbi:hypothetical protein PanWU01x14_042100 [Parasponia andersonii]|uniref:Uncharacterized protein n=1 Tax=Parasponia andersonii TaxID=3476 RepID=A0A2P5DQL0_PARAD|nr:hypothetical protein PanWU01x14_042100 [Parasponia andersonii]
MQNTLEEFQILHCLHVQARALKTPRIVQVYWLVPPASWLKVNIYGSALGSPSLARCGDIFLTSRGFFKGAFAISLGKTYAFEAELAEEDNAFADILTSRATSIQASTWWHTTPSFINDAFSNDYTGQSVFRFS